MLRCMLEAVEGWLYLLEALEVLGVLGVLGVLELLEVMRCVLLCMLWRVALVDGAGSGGGWALLLDVLEVMRCVLRCMLEAVEGDSDQSWR